MTDEYYMELALKEARKSLGSGDIPIGAVVVLDGKVVSRAHNTREKDQLATGHAEINAITKANKKMGRYRLDGGVIYVTKEPCLMCMGTILSARISRIVYGMKDLRFGTEELARDNKFNHKCDITGGVLEEECSALVSQFFKTLRGNNENSRKTTNITKENN